MASCGTYPALSHQAAEGTRHLDIEEMGRIRLPRSSYPNPDRRALRSRLDEKCDHRRGIHHDH
jgi:hypothetical protein